MICEMEDELQVLDSRIDEYRGLLAFVASRVLGGPDGVEEAVCNCLHAAARASTEHMSKGELGSWLVRILIDEALVVRQLKLN